MADSFYYPGKELDLKVINEFHELTSKRICDTVEELDDIETRCETEVIKVNNRVNEKVTVIIDDLEELHKSVENQIEECIENNSLNSIQDSEAVMVENDAREDLSNQQVFEEDKKEEHEHTEQCDSKTKTETDIHLDNQTRRGTLEVDERQLENSEEGWVWQGDCIEVVEESPICKYYYSEAQKKGVLVKLNDVVFLHGRDRHYLGKVLKMWEAANKKMAKIQWFYLAEELTTPIDFKYPGAVLKSESTDENELDTINDKCQVVSFREYRKLFGEDIEEMVKASNIFYAAGNVYLNGNIKIFDSIKINVVRKRSK